MKKKGKILIGCVAIFAMCFGITVLKEDAAAQKEVEPIPMDIPIFVIEHEDYKARVTREATVYEGPTEEYFSVCAKLDIDEIVHVVGTCDNENWLLAVFGESEGWIRKEYLARILHDGESYSENSCYNKSTDGMCLRKPNDVTSEGLNHAIQRCENTEISVSSCNGFIQPEGRVRLSCMVEANRIWNNCPEGIRNLLIENGWEIYITDEDIQEKFALDSPASGVTFVQGKQMYIEDDIKCIRRSIMHETAHAIDITHGMLSDSLVFRFIYGIEKNTYCSDGRITDDYETSSPAEFFAYVLTDILYGYDSAKNTAPMAYSYVLNVLTNMI